MKTKYIIILLAIILFIIFLTQKKEHAGSTSTENIPLLTNDSIKNIANIYATTSMNANFTNMNINKDVKITGQLDIDKWRGIIFIFSGDITNIPLGWALCDGTKDTPDLRGRFVLGQGQGSGLTNRNMKNTGGKETHILSESELPSHDHRIHTGSGSGSTPAGRVTQWEQKNDNGFKDDNIIENTGASKGHENMPPYYALAYIMKL